MRSMRRCSSFSLLFNSSITVYLPSFSRRFQNLREVATQQPLHKRQGVEFGQVLQAFAGAHKTDGNAQLPGDGEDGASAAV